MTRSQASLAGALALLAAACGSAPAAPRPAPSDPSTVATAPAAASSASAVPLVLSRQDRLIEAMLGRVEIARGIQATRRVPGVVLDRATMMARVKAHAAEEVPPEALRNEGLALQLLGFLPTDLDYEQTEYDLLQAQLAGYYEPADGTMYLAADLDDEEAEAALAHELVHALQDQRWNLEERSRYRPGRGDALESLAALGEGDATSAMFDVMIARAPGVEGKTAIDAPDSFFVKQIRKGMNEGPGASTPHVMRTALSAPYIYGVLFVHALRRRGGWAAVDRAWDDPPTTTEQILHVDKWLAREPPLPVAAPAFATLGPGWTASDEDSEGEIGARLIFEEWAGAQDAVRVSEGWGGDRDVVLTSGDRAAFAWRLRYDPAPRKDERAARAFAALAGALGSTRRTDPDFLCLERADRGPLAVTRSGSDLVVTGGPAVTTKGAWTSGGTCALARKWSREIVAR